MPQTDPNAMNAALWADVSLWLTYLWIYFPLIIVFAFSMLIAHGLIPSGVQTGTYPAFFSRLRLPLTDDRPRRPGRSRGHDDSGRHAVAGHVAKRLGTPLRITRRAPRR